MDQRAAFWVFILITYARGLVDPRSQNFGETSEIHSDWFALEQLRVDVRIMNIIGFGVIICLIRE